MEISSLFEDEKTVEQARSFFIKRIGRINRDSAVILDKKSSYGLTSFFVADILERKAKGQTVTGVKDTDVSSMISAIQEFSSHDDIESVKDNQRIVIAMKRLGVAVPKLESPKIRANGNSVTLRWTFTDIFGNNVDAPRRATVKFDGRTEDVTDSQVTLKTDKSDVTVELIQSVDGFTYTTRHHVHVGQELSISQLKLATTKGNERIKEYPYEEGGSIICNQDNKLHIQFKVDKSLDAEYAAFYLKHSELKEFDRITAASALTYLPEQSKCRS